jgi:hypothetical protein
LQGEESVAAATEVKVPDIGDYKNVPIIEVHVKEGDAVNADDPLITLESDKATMDVPAPSQGTVDKLFIKIGDKVSAGSPILLFRGGDGAMTQPPSLLPQQEPAPATPAPPPPALDRAPAADFRQVHASPGVRRVAREYGKGVFPWAASGRSLSLGRDEGLTKVLFEENTQRIIGCGIVGPNAGDLIAEAALAIEMGADAEDIGLTIHPHPTLSETIGMAAEAFEGTITDLYISKKR